MSAILKSEARGLQFRDCLGYAQALVQSLVPCRHKEKWKEETVGEKE